MVTPELVVLNTVSELLLLIAIGAAILYPFRHKIKSDLSVLKATYFTKKK